MPLSKEKKSQLAHFLAAIIITVKGIDKIDHHHPIGGSILIGIGIVIFLLTIHHRLASYIKSFDALVFLVEAIVLGIVSGLYVQDGKSALPIAYGMAAVGYLFAAYRAYQRDKRRPAHH